MSVRSSRYFCMGKKCYNVDASFFAICFWVLLRDRRSTIKQMYSWRNLFKAWLLYVWIRYIRPEQLRDRISIFPYGYVGIRVGRGIRIFDFKNEVVYKEKGPSNQMEYINRYPSSAKIVGVAGGFWMEEFIAGETLYRSQRVDVRKVDRIYCKHIRNCIFENARNNSPVLIKLSKYIQYLENRVEGAFKSFWSGKEVDSVRSQLIGILDDLSVHRNFKVPLVVSHGDLHPGNIVLNGGSVRFIDFEFCGFRSFLFDLFDYFYLWNNAFPSVKINPRRDAMKQAISLSSELGYDYDEVDIGAFQTFYIVERMVIHLSVNETPVRKIREFYRQLTEFGWTGRDGKCEFGRLGRI